MEKVFESYADFYDLFYKNKNYQEESDFLLSLIKEYAPKAQSLLELGVGSGGHARYVAKNFKNFVGVDQSKGMLEKARENFNSINLSQSTDWKLQEQDITKLKLDQQFDLIISVFHVFSYLTKNNQLEKSFQAVCDHLQPGGHFIFDFWYGPTVLNLGTQVTTRNYQDENITLERYCQSELISEENIVNVNFTLKGKKSNGALIDIKERHPMRYFFLPELDYFLEKAGMARIKASPWCSFDRPSNQTWGHYVLAQRKL